MAHPLNEYTLALAIIAAWCVVVYVLWKKGALAKASMSPVGPIIMWKTARGRQFLDRLARRKRFWRAYGDLSILLCLIAMVGLTALLVWEATLVPSIPSENAPAPELLLGVPGLNPVIPLGYGILGLAIAIVLHEFLHGILARTANVPLKSLGILLFVVPIGAFVEPDENEMGKMKRRERARLFAAGPATNMILALICALIFSVGMMGSVRPAHRGVGITDFSMDNSPAEQAGLVPGMIIFRANGTDIDTLSQFVTVMETKQPGQLVAIEAYYRGTPSFHTVNLTRSSDDRAIMGVRLMTITTAYFHPLGGAEHFGGLSRSIFSYITLPFLGIQPTQGAVADFYSIDGAWASVPAPVFWTLANSFYWLFWLNLMLGATNALPAVPLDGGYIFRDGLDAFLEKLRKGATRERREKTVRTTSYVIALFILALILWQFIGPRVL